MQKIATMFERDWEGDRSRVLPTVTPACQWVADGVGYATIKLDGTCALVDNARLFKRRELKKDQAPPPGFSAIATDAETGKTVGWVLIGDGPDDQYFREAWVRGHEGSRMLDDGTYELVGPRVQGGIEGYPEHVLIRHGAIPWEGAPRDFDGLKAFFEQHPEIEGLVFYDGSGAMAKIKGRDFGVKRQARQNAYELTRVA